MIKEARHENESISIVSNQAFEPFSLGGDYIDGSEEQACALVEFVLRASTFQEYQDAKAQVTKIVHERFPQVNDFEPIPENSCIELLYVLTIAPRTFAWRCMRRSQGVSPATTAQQKNWLIHKAFCTLNRVLSGISN